jgi:hypothetical protein
LVVLTASALRQGLQRNVNENAVQALEASGLHIWVGNDFGGFAIEKMRATIMLACRHRQMGWGV